MRAITHGAVTRCRACGGRIVWDADDLAYHARRLDRGEHAACACDDDCAAVSPSWTRAELRRVMRRAEAAVRS